MHCLSSVKLPAHYKDIVINKSSIYFAPTFVVAAVPEPLKVIFELKNTIDINLTKRFRLDNFETFSDLAHKHTQKNYYFILAA